MVVQLSYGLYGGAVTSSIGFVLLLHKTLTWNTEKDGSISKFKREELTITTVMILFGIITLGIIYGYLFKDNQPIWLVILNIIVFCLGVTARVLLINGKTQSQYLYIGREFVDIGILIAMIQLNLANDNILMRFASSFSTFLILGKSVVNWEYEARKNNKMEKIDYV
ncbi:TPA: nicotinamide mononucleotide transporter [Streptococcus agalactiae]